MIQTVTVCDACGSAACWQGKFYCDDYKTAGTVEVPVCAYVSKETGRQCARQASMHTFATHNFTMYWATEKSQ